MMHWENYLRAQADPYFIPPGRAFGGYAQGQLIRSRPVRGRTYGDLGYLDTYNYQYGGRFLQGFGAEDDDTITTAEEEENGDIVKDAEGYLGDAQEGIASAEGLIDDVGKVTSGGEDFVLWFGTWSGPPIQAPAISDNALTSPTGAWSGSKWIQVHDGLAFVKALAQGFTFDSKAAWPGPSYGKFNFIGPPRSGAPAPVKPKTAHTIWDLKTGKWVASANASPEAKQAQEGLDHTGGGEAGSKPTSQTGQAILDQMYVNTMSGWGNPLVSPGMDQEINAMASYLTTAVKPGGPPFYGFKSLKRVLESAIRRLSFTAAKRAIDNDMTVTKGQRSGQKYKALHPLWVQALLAVMANAPAHEKPYNAQTLTELATGTAPGDTSNVPTTPTTGKAGGAGMAIGIGALLFMLMRFLG